MKSENSCLHLMQFVTLASGTQVGGAFSVDIGVSTFDLGNSKLTSNKVFFDKFEGTKVFAGKKKTSSRKMQFS